MIRLAIGVLALFWGLITLYSFWVKGFQGEGGELVFRLVYYALGLAVFICGFILLLWKPKKSGKGEPPANGSQGGR